MLSPALRLEFPLRVERKLFSREWVFHSCWQALQNGRTVAIGGAGGVGKTTLGSFLANKWGRHNVFWFTVRPGLNDNAQSLAFAMGHFLKTLNEPTLYQEKLTKKKKIN